MRTTDENTHYLIDGFYLPKVIDFGYGKYEIILSEEIVDDFNGRNLGETCFDTFTVKIDKNQPEAAILECYIHELTHILLEISGYGEFSGLHTNNEQMTLMISRHFLTLLRLNTFGYKQNPVLANWIPGAMLLG